MDNVLIQCCNFRLFRIERFHVVFLANFHLIAYSPAKSICGIDLPRMLSGTIYYETRKTIGFAFVSRPRIRNSLWFDRTLNMSGRDIGIFGRAPIRDLFENSECMSLRVVITNDNICRHKFCCLENKSGFT